MGDAADLARSMVADFEDDIYLYHTRLITDGEAYDRGIIDELGREISSSTGRTCRCCGISGLHWQQHNGKWRLFTEANLLHDCPVNPLVEAITVE